MISDANKDFWSKDLPLFQELGINVLRVYETDPRKSHAQFMKDTASLGIYVLFDLPNSLDGLAINRQSPNYTLEYLDFLKRQVDSLSGYENTMGFLIGNEVANQKGKVTRSAAYVKASLRDVKMYIRQRGLDVPVGYAAVDDNDIRQQERDYFLYCGPPEERVDFYALNVYSYCGDKSNLRVSGYLDRAKEFQDVGVPVFFAEYGCNVVQPRTFAEVPALYGDEMMRVFSGGIAYEYSQEVNGYGVVKISAGGDRQPLADYEALKSRLEAIDIDRGSVSISSTGGGRSNACPEVSEDWQSSSHLPATPSETLCQCVIESAQCSPKMDQVEDAGEMIDLVCGYLIKAGGRCAEIEAGDASLGEYGRFSACENKAKLAYAMSEYYRRTGDCNWGGTGQLRQGNDANQCSGTVKTGSSMWLIALLLMALSFH